MLNPSEVMYKYREDRSYSLKDSHSYFGNAVVNVRNGLKY